MVIHQGCPSAFHFAILILSLQHGVKYVYSYLFAIYHETDFNILLPFLVSDIFCRRNHRILPSLTSLVFDFPKKNMTQCVSSMQSKYLSFSYLAVPIAHPELGLT